MLPKEVKELIERYCMGMVPTPEQEDEIMDAVFAANADQQEVIEYIEKMKSGPTREQVAAEEAKRKAKKLKEDLAGLKQDAKTFLERIAKNASDEADIRNYSLKTLVDDAKKLGASAADVADLEATIEKERENAISAYRRKVEEAKRKAEEEAREKAKLEAERKAAAEKRKRDEQAAAERTKREQEEKRRRQIIESAKSAAKLKIATDALDDNAREQIINKAKSDGLVAGEIAEVERFVNEELARVAAEKKRKAEAEEAKRKAAEAKRKAQKKRRRILYAVIASIVLLSYCTSRCEEDDNFEYVENEVVGASNAAINAVQQNSSSTAGGDVFIGISDAELDDSFDDSGYDPVVEMDDYDDAMIKAERELERQRKRAEREFERERKKTERELEREMRKAERELQRSMEGFAF